MLGVINPKTHDKQRAPGWEPPAAQRLRFVLDFAYATGLRVSELIGATLGAIETDAHGDRWLHVIGKGGKAGKVRLHDLGPNRGLNS